MEKELRLSEIKFYHSGFDGNKEYYKTYLFFYKKNFYKACIENIIYLVDQIPKINFIQTAEKTNFFFTRENEKFVVYKLKYHPHIVHIYHGTKLQKKQMLISLIETQKQLLESNLCIYDNHELNFGLTLDGFKFFDHDAVINCNEKVNSDSADLYGYVKLCYLICRYLKNHDVNYVSFNDEILKKIEPKLYDIIGDNKKITKEHYDQVLNYVQEIQTDAPKSHWSDEYTYHFEWLENPEKYPKIGNVNQILKKIKYKTALDIGCNKGLYTFLIGKYGQSTLGFDIDEKCINFCLENNKQEYKCLFSQILLDDLFLNQYKAIDFYQSELIVVLALVHHLKIQKISSEKFCHLLSKLSKQYILIEDIDSAHEYEIELNKLSFKLINRLPSYPDGRTISLFQRSN